MKLPPANYPEVKMLLEFLEDKMLGKLTQDQLNLACVFWTYDKMDKFSYIPLPVEPLALREWRGLHQRQKDAASDDVKSRMSAMFHGFWSEHDSINHENRSQLTYLLEVERGIRKYDPVKADRVLVKTREYKTRGVESWS